MTRTSRASGQDGPTQFAALTAGLLARKGEAIPAAPSFIQEPAAFAPIFSLAERRKAPPTEKSATAQEPAQPGAKAAETPVAEDEKAKAKAPQSPPQSAAVIPHRPRPAVPAPTARAIPDPVGARAKEDGKPRKSTAGAEPPRVPVTVRLTAGHYVRLRLAAISLDISNQELMRRALDAYLEALGPKVAPTCACIDQKLL